MSVNKLSNGSENTYLFLVLYLQIFHGWKYSKPKKKKKKVNERTKEELYPNVLGGITQIEYII